MVQYNRCLAAKVLAVLKMNVLIGERKRERDFLAKSRYFKVKMQSYLSKWIKVYIFINYNRKQKLKEEKI